MSDYIPLEIQSEIIKKLPVKLVVQCRTVSKQWKSLIDSPNFITTYHSCKTHLFVKYDPVLDGEFKFSSIIEDDTFPHQKYSLTVPHPLCLIKYTLTANSVKGLLCFYGSRKKSILEKIAVLWNPTVEKAVGIDISKPLRRSFGGTFIGFGVCPKTSDPILVRINTIGNPTVNWEVEIFMLSTRVWKSVYNIPSTLKTCDMSCHSVFVDGIIYCHAFDSMKLPYGTRSNLIISFDIISNEFGEVCLPNRLVHIHPTELVVSKVYESLGLYEYYNDGDTRICDIWIMKAGFIKSFTKILSIKGLDTWGHFRVLMLRNNGEAIIHNIGDPNSMLFEVYDPSSGFISNVGINGCSYSFSVYSKTESLLLLNESSCIIH